MSAIHHKSEAGEQKVRIAIVTVSDTRTPDTDKNGQYLKLEIEAAGHELVDYRLIRDETDLVILALDELDAQVLLFNGGTGISRRDTTFDALSGKLQKTLPGFGEIFRMLSYQEIGSAAMLSRATAGIYKGKVVFSTPGSTNAVKLAWQKLILPELNHLAWELSR